MTIRDWAKATPLERRSVRQEEGWTISVQKGAGGAAEEESNTTPSESRLSMASAAHTGDFSAMKVLLAYGHSSKRRRAAFSPSAVASRMLSTALAWTPPMNPSPIHGIRSATSAGAWTQ